MQFQLLEVKQRQDHEARVMEIQRHVEQDKQRHESDQMVKNMMMQMMMMMKGNGTQPPPPPPAL
jgi:hypothetical protein